MILLCDEFATEVFPKALTLSLLMMPSGVFNYVLPRKVLSNITPVEGLLIVGMPRLLIIGCNVDESIDAVSR